MVDETVNPQSSDEEYEYEYIELAEGEELPADADYEYEYVEVPVETVSPEEVVAVSESAAVTESVSAPVEAASVVVPEPEVVIEPEVTAGPEVVSVEPVTPSESVAVSNVEEVVSEVPSEVRTADVSGTVSELPPVADVFADQTEKVLEEEAVVDNSVSVSAEAVREEALPEDDNSMLELSQDEESLSEMLVDVSETGNVVMPSSEETDVDLESELFGASAPVNIDEVPFNGAKDPVEAAPVVAPEPEVTSEPIVMSEPVSAPVEAAPVVVPEPEVTSEPLVMSEPVSAPIEAVSVVAPEPEVTSEPLVMSEPVSASVEAAPVVAPEPEVISEPIVMSEPVSAPVEAAPVVAPEPEVTSEPIVMSEPVSAPVEAAPVVALEPEVTSEPIVMSESVSAPVEAAPVVAPEPEVTSEPIVMSEPVSAPVEAVSVVAPEPEVTSEPIVMSEPVSAPVEAAPVVAPEPEELSINETELDVIQDILSGEGNIESDTPIQENVPTVEFVQGTDTTVTETINQEDVQVEIPEETREESIIETISAPVPVVDEAVLFGKEIPQPSEPEIVSDDVSFRFLPLSDEKYVSYKNTAKMFGRMSGVQTFNGDEAHQAILLDDINYQGKELEFWSVVIFKTSLISLPEGSCSVRLEKSSETIRYARVVKNGFPELSVFNEEDFNLDRNDDEFVQGKNHFIYAKPGLNTGIIINDFENISLADKEGMIVEFGVPVSGMLAGPENAKLYFANVREVVVPTAALVRMDEEKLQANNAKWYSGSLSDKYFELSVRSGSCEFVGNEEIKSIHVNVGTSTYGWNVTFDNGIVMSFRDLQEFQNKHGALPSANGVISHGQLSCKFHNMERIVVYEIPQYFAYGRM